MSFMLRARETGATRHRLVGKDRLVDRRVHAVMIEGQPAAEDYARWLLEHNPGPDGFDSVQVIDAFRKGAPPVAVFTAAGAGSGTSPENGRAGETGSC